MTSKALIAGNWKMNGLLQDGVALAKAVAEGASSVSGSDFVVCPPATLLFSVSQALSGSSVGLGAQYCHPADSGAHTGDISASMLSDVGCGYVIVGHSERRQDHGETDADVQAQAAAVLAAGMTAIICIGETEAERDAGETLNRIRAQLDGSVPNGAATSNTIIAYEPVWAIGTGRTPSAEEANEVHAAVRSHLSGMIGGDASELRILYGGSMKPGNASELLAQPDIDGGLIGGAALKADDFLAIGRAAAG
ncbi:MAG: triose-phosphate isomerase [Alphaproteobacteria bacterium]